MRRAMLRPVVAHPVSRIAKLSPQMDDGHGRCVPLGSFVAATWATTRGTCPSTCSFLGRGCYAEATGWFVHALNEAAAGWTGSAINSLEAGLIDRLFVRGVPQDGGRHGDRGRDLRLHVSGDFVDAGGTTRIGEAVERYLSRAGGIAWAPTHRRDIPRDAFGPIEVMMSCESSEQVEEARALGFAATLVVAQFPYGAKVFRLPGSSLKYVPCPEQASGRVTCVECRLCLDTAVLLRKGIVIVFAAHGRDAAKVRHRLPLLP